MMDVNPRTSWRPVNSQLPPPQPAHSYPSPQPAYHSSKPPQEPNLLRYPSPTPDGRQLMSDPHLRSEAEDLSHRLTSARPEVVRLVLRNLFEMCFIGSEYHASFLLNIVMHESSPDVLRRSIDQFGGRLAKDCAREISSHWGPTELDQLAPTLLARCGSSFLDKAIEMRLETIPAQNLVNALAKANRLGYNAGDIVQTFPGPAGHHHSPQNTLPPMASQPVMAPHPAAPLAPPNAVALPDPTALSLGIAYCNSCKRPCSGKLALNHHQKRLPCSGWSRSVIGKDVCLHCGQRFDGNGGLAYHAKHSVCGTYSDQVIEKMEQLMAAAYTVPPGAAPGHAPMQPAPINNVHSGVHSNNHSPSHHPHGVHGGHAGHPGHTGHGGPHGTPVSHGGHGHPHGTPGSHGSHGSHMSAPGSPSSDPYASLTSTQRQMLQKEIQDAEDKFADRMKEAMMLPSSERDVKLANLKNGLNNKQSMIRKKYGIRLRGRRTRADMQAERERMLGSSAPIPRPLAPSHHSTAPMPSHDRRGSTPGEYLTASSSSGFSQRNELPPIRAEGFPPPHQYADSQGTFSQSPQPQDSQQHTPQHRSPHQDSVTHSVSRPQSPHPRSPHRQSPPQETSRLDDSRLESPRLHHQAAPPAQATGDESQLQHRGGASSPETGPASTNQGQDDRMEIDNEKEDTAMEHRDEGSGQAQETSA